LKGVVEANYFNRKATDLKSLQILLPHTSVHLMGFIISIITLDLIVAPCAL